MKAGRCCTIEMLGWLNSYESLLKVRPQGDGCRKREIDLLVIGRTERHSGYPGDLMNHAISDGKSTHANGACDRAGDLHLLSR